MAGGIGSFVAGIEGLTCVEKLSDIWNLSPRTLLYGAGFVLGAFVVIVVWLGIVQGAFLPAESIELDERTTSLERSPTDFDEEVTAALATAAAPKELTVYVTGAVGSPGLHTLAEGKRIGDAVEVAGGLTADAATAVVNLAQLLTDGTQIHIPRKDEVSSDMPTTGATSTGSSGDTGGGQAALVNINTADSSALQTLDGVGPATAQKIIEYRESRGAFQGKEDLMNVSGIGEKKYATIEAHITV